MPGSAAESEFRPRPHVGTLRLLWSPGSLAQVAECCSIRKGVIVGTIVGVVDATLLMVWVPYGGGEPYRDWWDYARDTAAMAMVWFAVFGGFGFIVADATLKEAQRTVTADYRVKHNLVFLAPLTVVLPILIWTAFAWLHAATRSSFQFYGPAANPVWLLSPLVRVFGSPLWLLVVPILVVRNVRRGFARIDDYIGASATPRCAHCDYLLLGLTVPRCPECGHAFDPALLQSAEPSAADPHSP